MSKYNYSDIEQQINNVLAFHNCELNSIDSPNVRSVNDRISESEKLLKSLGFSLPEKTTAIPQQKPVMVVPSWESLCKEAESVVGSECELESIFSQEELSQNSVAIKQLKREFNALHHLDKFDIMISATAGILGAAVDLLMVGIPQKTPNGLSAGKLSDFIRSEFEKKFPEAEMERLANSKVSKVPFDAQDNRNTTAYVEGLSAYYHRLLSLGHDPLLGLIFGVFDILTGRMTTIDKTGKIVSQVMKNYADRTEKDIFAALAKLIIHFKSDITTSMGLPAPLMGLFNLFQFGSIGEENQTIAEIVQGMYYEGYDFIHFCSTSVPVMLIEVVVRLGYALKRIKEGHSIKESIPFSLNREKHPKLAIMLFISHTGATAINAGKVYFTENPMVINYPQWIAFAKYSYSQLKWVLIQRPELQDRYISGHLNEELTTVISDIDNSFEDISKNYIVVFEGNNT